MRLVFAGTPDVAVPSLDALVGSHHEVVAVLTRPPARAGRGRESRPSAVHLRAETLGIPVLTPVDLRADGVAGKLRSLAPDCCPVVAYGRLIPGDVLDVPMWGWVNLHFSLLPRWRGAAPVQHAIRHGDAVTGVTTFRIDEGLDTGPILESWTTEIQEGETSGGLLARLSGAGGELLVATMDAIEAGRAVGYSQSSLGVTLAPRIEVNDARIDWSAPAEDIDRLVRACTPDPGAWTTLGDLRLRLDPIEITDTVGAPGMLHSTKREVLIGTGTTAVRLSTVTAPGRRSMDAADWARGLRLDPDVVCI